MKKAAVPLAVLVIFIVLAVFFFIFASGILSEGGVLRRSTSAVDEAIQKVPGVGDDEINRIALPPTPKEVQEGFNSLIKALNRDASSPCIAEYGEKSDKGGFSDLKGYTIEVLRYSEAANEPKFIAQLRVPAPDGRLVDAQYVNNEVCVVGGEIYNSKIYIGDSEKIVAATVDGEGNVETKTHFEGLKTNLGYDKDNIKWAAKNFYTNWIEDLSKKETLYQTIRTDGKRIVSPDYTNPASITITGATSMDVSYSGGKNSWGKEDGGLVYVPENGKVCVFATVDDWTGDCEAHADGIESDCLDTDAEVITLTKNVGTCS